jgi:CheY-like chemotaxis protein
VQGRALSLPRLLLVEDDASIRRFVTMALEDCELDTVQADSLKSAIQALRSGPFALVLCDLMLPDGSGLELLRALAGADSPSPDAWRVAFSAGVSGGTRQQLLALGVHEVLAKPTSLAALLSCVQTGLAAAQAKAASGAAQWAPSAAQGGPQGGPHSDLDDAVVRYFGGHRGLYDAYAAQCHVQFGHDATLADAAAASQDMPALRRLAHSLKTVLLTLGHSDDAALALAAEQAAEAGQRTLAWAHWDRLRARLRLLAAAAPGHAGSPTKP